MIFNNYLPFLSAVVPSIVILLIFYFQDKYPEPWSMIIKTFFFGCLICLPAYYLNVYFMNFIHEYYSNYRLSYDQAYFLNYLIPGALVEEVLKFLVLYFFCFKSKHLDEKIDALVYGVTVSLGFAAIENLTFIYDAELYGETWSNLAWIRAFTAVPAHACWGMIMGYFLYTYKGQIKGIFLALTIPILLHMLYNSSYLSYGLVLVFSIFLAITFFSNSKKIQRMNIWS